MNTGRITFRNLRETDLPLMFRWLNTPHVSEWWHINGNHQPSFKEVERQYLPRASSADPVDCYLIIYDDKPIGMIQSCRLDDYPAEKASFDLDQSCAAIDLFIGDEDYVYKGLGSAIIRKFAKEIVFANYDVPCCIIDPDPKNEIAIKAYRKAGFKYLKTVWNPKDDVYAYIMSISRDEVNQAKGKS